MGLMEATRRALSRPTTVIIWALEVDPGVIPELAQVAERWFKAAYYLYPHRVLPVPGSGLVAAELLPLLAKRYLSLTETTEPLAVLAFRPRLRDRLERILVDQADIGTDGAASAVVDRRTGAEQVLEVPVGEAWLSSVDLQIQDWTPGETVRVTLWDGSRRAVLGHVLRHAPSAAPPERFVFSPPVPVKAGHAVRLEISHGGGGDGAVRVRGRMGRLWLRAFATEPAARPVIEQPLGTLFVVEGRGAKR